MKAAGKKDISRDLTFYRFIIDSLPVAVFTVDSELKITSFNPWAEHLTGYSSKEATGRYCGELLRGGMCAHNCPLKTAISRRQSVVRLESVFRNKDGEEIPVRMNTAALLKDDGSLIGAVETFQDISLLKSLEREKDNLISMFAHDMKSSLTIIGGFVLRLLKKGGELDEGKQGRYLEVIQKETNKLDFIVNDFLEFSRLRTGELKLNFQAVSLDKELMEIVESYQPKEIESGVSLKLFNEKVLPVIEADPARLRRVFTNILDNAFKFSTRGGTISISAEETGSEVLITVEDQGRGIEADDLPYIFEMFRRGKNAADTEGSGVGLAATKAIVEGHKGRITVTSRPGKGSVFTVVLPKTGRRAAGL